jgi:UDP-N-acetylmuramoyl-L-alanyl-D-glutamate--2,6-diaminopimelate ligase
MLMDLRAAAASLPAGLTVSLTGPDAQVSGITHDSRRVQPQTLFCCVPGATTDGHNFARQAVADGASALLVDRPLDLPIAQLGVTDVRLAMAYLADTLNGRPSRTLAVIGVTGTNGKTTTTWLLRALLDAAGLPCGLIGTLSGSHTTPEAPDFQAALAGFVDAGMLAAAVEISSHALALHRVDATWFPVAVFTNLSRDHLDLHGSEAAYFAAKARLFEPVRCGTAVINRDDEHGRKLMATLQVPVHAFGMADATDITLDARSACFTWRGHRVRLPLGGAFSVANGLAAATAAEALGLSPNDIAEGLSGATAVPGRFEPIEAGQSFGVIVDYAHTPDGLRAALGAARGVTERRLIVVFGCGGNRDASKRPLMGEIAVELADFVVVTSDNPRGEVPAAIISDVVNGFPPDSEGQYLIEQDRREAIASAFDMAKAGDVVLIAGKGHETTQTVGDRVLAFDDRVVARELLGLRA